MSRNRLRLSFRQRLWFHGSFAVLFLSGALWWILHRWFPVQTEFGSQENPLNSWLLRLHGAAAMIALVVLGSLLPNHVRAAWRAHRNRFSGGGMIALSAALTLTGYGLYYAAGETLRLAASLSHLGLGLAFPGVLIWHIRRGRALRRRLGAPHRNPPDAQSL
ncbi:MAG: DUF4405 domain-containing protein [Verrucomicrobia bacterium]|nr:DUF4405 domain-containing protein [Verrucomicrobiota bacterium]